MGVGRKRMLNALFELPEWALFPRWFRAIWKHNFSRCITKIEAGRGIEVDDSTPGIVSIAVSTQDNSDVGVPGGEGGADPGVIDFPAKLVEVVVPPIQCTETGLSYNTEFIIVLEESGA